MASKRAKPDWKALREALWIRSDGLCEVTGLALDLETFDAHHRRPKGMGSTYRPGTDTLANLLALHPVVHNGSPGSVHQSPSWSRPRGYLLHQGVPDEDLATTPVLYRGTTWVVLTDPEYGIMNERSQRYLNRVLAIADQVAADAVTGERERRREAYRAPRPYGQYQ